MTEDKVTRMKENAGRERISVTTEMVKWRAMG